MAHQRQRQTQAHTPSSETRLQALRDELDAANRKADRYVQLVGTLYEELDNLRRSVCPNCRKKFVLSYSSTPSLDRPPSGPNKKAPSVYAGESPSTLIPVHPITPLEDQANPSVSSPPQAAGRFLNTFIPIRPITLSRTVLAPRQASSATPRQPPTILVNEIQSKQPEWIVSHNPKIKQSLQIDLVKHFNCTANVYCVKFSPDGKYLAVGLDEGSGKTYIYDVGKGSNICLSVDPYLKQLPAVLCVQFSPDNKYIATVSTDRRIRLWEIARKRTRAAFPVPVGATSICFSQNSRLLVAGDARSTVHTWSTRDGFSKTLEKPNDDTQFIFSVTFSLDGRHIAAGDSGGWLRIWEARTGRLLDEWKGHEWNAPRVMFKQDGKGLVSIDGRSTLNCWDVSSLAVMVPGQAIAGTPGQRFQQIQKFEAHFGTIHSISLSHDFRYAASSFLDGRIRIWDPWTAECKCKLHREGGSRNTFPRTVEFSPATKYLASGGGDQAWIWRYREV